MGHLMGINMRQLPFWACQRGDAMVARRNVSPLFCWPLLAVGLTQQRGKMWHCRVIIYKGFLLLAIFLVAWPLWRAFWKGKRCIRCEMSLMAPEYEELGHLISSDQGHKYRLFRYHDHSLPNHHRDLNPHCTPVLFVPGNSGSYRQVRSFASQLLRDSVATPSSSQCYNVYTVDFREEFVAFSAHLLLHQIEYVQKVVQHLCQNIFNRPPWSCWGIATAASSSDPPNPGRLRPIERSCL